jgi:hypothetical protein
MTQNGEKVILLRTAWSKKPEKANIGCTKTQKQHGKKSW